MNTIMLSNDSISQERHNDTRWLDYFSLTMAMQGLNAHLATKLSDNTPEKHTRRNYMRGIMYFLGWASGVEVPEGKLSESELRRLLFHIERNMQMPTKQLLTKFIAHLLHEKEWGKKVKKVGVSPLTVANNYMAPVRVFIGCLVEQQIFAPDAERLFAYDCKDAMRTALTLKNPPQGDVDGTVWNPKFVRLTMVQINNVLKSFDTSTLDGARNYAIIRLFIESCYRAAELQRVRLMDIEEHGRYSIIRVRGKRQSERCVPKAVAVSRECTDAISYYVHMYNSQLEPGDPRYIRDDIPVWQSLTSGGNIRKAEQIFDPEKHDHTRGTFDPEKGLSYSAIKQLTKGVTRMTLGEKYQIAPHGWRRAGAAAAAESEMGLTQIKKKLRHKKSGQTLDYIGEKPTLDDTLMTDYLTIA